MENNVCKNKKMAISILEAIALHTDIRARAAIQAVIEYIERVAFDIPEDPEERRKLIEEIERELALVGTEADHKKLLQIYGELLPDDEPNFNVVILPPGSNCMLRTEEEGEDYAGNNL